MQLLPTIRDFFHQSGVSQSLANLGRCVGGLDRIVVLGGVLRELSLSQRFSAKPQIPDIDVAVLVDINPVELMQSLGEHACALNSFGGIKWYAQNSLPLDIWTARVWAERIAKPSKSQYCVEEMKTFLDFNLNAGTYAPYDGQIDVQEIIEGIANRRLELHNSLVPPDSVQLARILKLERRIMPFGLELGPKLRQYVLGVVASIDSSALREAQNYFHRKSNFRGATDTYFTTRISQLASELAPSSRHASTTLLSLLVPKFRARD